MLPSATRIVTHRFITTLMTLFRAVADVASAGGTRTFSELAAHATVHRLTRLIAALIRIATEGPRTRTHTQAQPKAAIRSTATPAAPNPLRTENGRLRTEPGWLLDALPDTAPAVAADLATLLADPALAPLFAAVPSLHRTLDPILRSLGLTPTPCVPPDPPSPHAPPPEPLPSIQRDAPPSPDRGTPPPQCPRAKSILHTQALSHIQTVTITQQKDHTKLASRSETSASR